MGTVEPMTGLCGRDEQGCSRQYASGQTVTALAARKIPGAAWITQAMVDDTKRVWSPRYGRDLPDGEAVEMLMNMKRLAAVLMRKGGPGRD